MSVTRKLAVALLAASALGLASAHAADIQRRMPTKAPAPMYTPPFSWTGFYIGANAGWAFGRNSSDALLGGVPLSWSGDTNGFVGGGQIGYNYQMGNIVAGLEADFQGSTNRGDVTFAGATTGTGTMKNPWFGTVRGRLGFAADRWLLYVTGGGLYGENKLDGTTVATGPFSSSATSWTWVVGGGVERMLWDRWSAKLEYLYAGNPSNNVPVPPGVTNVSTHSNTSIVRLGVNYHF